MEEFVTPIPDSFDSAHAAPLFCPGTTAYKAVRASEAAAGKTLGIFGIGCIDHSAIQIARIYGATVVATSRTNAYRLVKKVRADYVISYQENEDQFLNDLKHEEGLLDNAIVFAPSDEVINAAISSVKR